MTDLAERLRDPNPTTRRIALAGLIERPDAGAVEPVRLCLEDADEGIRHLAAVALSGIGLPALAGLQSALSAGQPEPVRAMAANGLARIGVDAAPAAAELAARLDDESDGVRWQASFALGRIGEPALPFVSDALDAPAPRVRIAAADAARFIGAPAASLEPRLDSLAQSPDKTEQLHANAALAAAAEDPSAALSRLGAATESPAPADRQAAVEIIGSLGPAGNAAAPRLLVRLDDDCPNVRGAAALALARVQAGDPPYVDAIKRLRDDDDTVRRLAAIALSGLEPAGA